MPDVTFVFTDVEGSTRLWQREPEAMASDLERHDRLVREAIEGAGGRVFATAGDSFAASFDEVRAAERAVRVMQQALRAEPWRVEGGLKVRAGIHCGTAQAREGDWFGPDVNLAARVMDAGHGGQVLVSGAAVAAGASADIDLGVHRLRDVQDEVHLYQLRLGDGEGPTGADSSHGPDEFPPLRTLSATRSLLPSYRTQLVARDDDIAAVRALLRGARLVTVVGVGGVGKTRLAVEVAAHEQAGRGVQAAFVDLAAVSDDAHVPRAILDGLALVGDPSVAPLAQVRAVLGRRRALLVLDNCEHLLDGVVDAVELLLDECPGTSVLATSREALGVDGETLLALSPIDEPAARRRLFVDRALTADPSFDPGPHEAAIDEVTRRLDGLPLAIELAASRTRVLTPEQILEHLTDRFALLTGGPRRAVPRQRTLLAAIEWSYDLLRPDEQDLLRRCSVCVGGFTLEAAAALGDLDRFAAVDVVDSLVGKSLVQVADSGAGRRYVMLETIRQFGVERLEAAGEVEATRERLLEHHLGDLRRRGVTMVVDTPLDDLRSDADNLSAAVGWALDAGETALAAELAVRATDLWVSSVAGAELARTLLPRLLATPDLSDHTRGQLLMLHSVLDMTMFDEGASMWPVYADQAVERLAGAPTPALAMALCQTVVLLSTIDTQRAFAQIDRASAVVAELGNPAFLTAWVAFHRAFALSGARRPAEALEVLRAAARLVPPGPSIGHGFVHSSAAEVIAILRGDADDALRACDLSMQSLHSSFWGLFDGTRRALALGRAGRPDEAARVLADDVARLGGQGIGGMADTHRLTLAVIAMARGDDDHARRVLGPLDPGAEPATDGSVRMARTPITTALLFEVLAELEGWPDDEFHDCGLARAAPAFATPIPPAVALAADDLIAAEAAAIAGRRPGASN